jgi:HEAT repeat protein
VAGRKARLLGAVLVLAFLGALVLIVTLVSEAPVERTLVSDLRNADPQLRARAAFELSQVVRPSVTAIYGLAHLLADSDEEPRGEAVAALISIGRGDSATSAVIVRGMRSLISGPGLGPPRVEAAHVLGQLGARSRTAVDALLSALRTPDEDPRTAAAAALGQIGIPDDVVLQALDLAVNDPAPDVRAMALESLTRLRPGDSTAHAAARVAIGDPSPAVRLTAVYSLLSASHYDRRVASALAFASRDSDADVRRAAVIALIRLAPDDTTTRRRLETLANDSVPRVRLAAEEGLHATTAPRP